MKETKWLRTNPKASIGAIKTNEINERKSNEEDGWPRLA
jgi:hypothetical protein